MDYSKINSITSNVSRFQQKNSLVKTIKNSDAETTKVIYAVPGELNVFVQFTYSEDSSYGDIGTLVGIEFLIGKEELVTVYETL